MSRLCDDISVMKYICKEFWSLLFTKQVDNLRTNNSVIFIFFKTIDNINYLFFDNIKGIFVLHDNNFRFLSQFIMNDPKSFEMCQNVFIFKLIHLRD